VAKDISAWPFSIGTCDSGSLQSLISARALRRGPRQGQQSHGHSRWRFEPVLPIATVPKVCPTQAHSGSFQRTWAHYQPMRERLRG